MLQDCGGYAHAGLALRASAGPRARATSTARPAWNGTAWPTTTTWTRCGTATASGSAPRVTFWPTEFSRLRLQGSLDRTGVARTTAIWAVFLALEVVIGAHGAHAF